MSLFVGIQTIYSQNKEKIEIGEINSIHSKVLSEEREYWISLPESYGDKLKSYKRYPIIILLDGHIHFKSSVGMIQFMGGSRNGYRQLPEMIVVGIMNVNRRRDFTPDKVITKRKNNTGGGDNFLAFLEQELIPKIDKDYRTIPYRILFGHSLGGLLTAHAYLQENSTFNSFISIDPSFGTWTDSIMDGKTELVNEKVFTRPIYIATANWDKRNIRNRDRHVRFYESLNSKCKGKYKGKIEYFENENHGTVPLPALYNGISFIFKDFNYPFRSATNRKELVNHFKEISQRLSYNFSPPEELVNRIGYNKLRSRNEDEKKMALEFFKLNVENYPESYNAYDSLGEVELEFDSKERALKNFEKSLELNPNNEKAKNMIAKIKNN
ncbi:MAG: putative alpha/beta superfamily hydrolase [Maribacter sp.]|jgi:predicted alpha/beta superfamily hydrolase